MTGGVSPVGGVSALGVQSSRGSALWGWWYEVPHNDDPNMTPQCRADFVALGLKMWTLSFIASAAVAVAALCVRTCYVSDNSSFHLYTWRSLQQIQ